MMCFLVIASLLILPAFSAEQKPGSPLTEPIALLLWAATDPKEDSQVGKIDPSKFFLFTEKHHDEFQKFHFSYDFAGSTKLLTDNAEESGTEGVKWPLVWAKLIIKSLTKQTEEKEHGLPSLISWVWRNTGTETKITSVDRRTLVNFLFAHKTEILKFQRDGDVDGLINFLESNKAESTSNDVDWKTVINGLKENRKLFKFSCGILDLQLCDNLKQ